MVLPNYLLTLIKLCTVSMCGLSDTNCTFVLRNTFLILVKISCLNSLFYNYPIIIFKLEESFI